MMAHPLICEIPNIWFDKWKYDDAEKRHHEAQLKENEPIITESDVVPDEANAGNKV